MMAWDGDGWGGMAEKTEEYGNWMVVLSN